MRLMLKKLKEKCSIDKTILPVFIKDCGGSVAQHGYTLSHTARQPSKATKLRKAESPGFKSQRTRQKQLFPLYLDYE